MHLKPIRLSGQHMGRTSLFAGYLGSGSYNSAKYGTEMLFQDAGAFCELKMYVKTPQKPGKRDMSEFA